MLQDILLLLAGLLIGAVAGFFIARTVMQKYLKKNPPITEDMIKTLMMQMGRKPNQKQINQMMKAMQNINKISLLRYFFVIIYVLVIL